MDHGVPVLFSGHRPYSTVFLERLERAMSPT